MKQSAYLVMVLVMSSVSIYAQPDETIPASEDSLQEDGWVESVAEDSLADSLLIPEEIEVTADIPIPNDPSSVLSGFLLALQSGDSLMVGTLISSDGLDEIEIMLEILKENLDDNEESTLSRLSAAGYSASFDEIDDWSPLDYLTHTVVLPVMKARYLLYEMQIGEYSNSGNDLIIPLVFRTASGVELPYEAALVKEDNQWKVTNFMGLNSFP